MKAAIISLTENGRKLSRLIAEKSDLLSSERFCFKNHSDDASHSFDSLSGLVCDIFQKYDALVFVCACGIAVRAVASHLMSKITDPAVIVIDDCGRYVIPILSGHIGGANALAKRLAELFNMQAVITTATDIGGRFSPDSFAVANDLLINDLETAKEAAAAVLEGEKIGFVSDYECKNLHPDLSADEDCDIGIYVGCADKQPFPATLKLIPKNVVLGIGCKRGTDCGTIENAVMTALKAADTTIERVCAAATIDLKSDEAGLLGFCEKYGLELNVYSAGELMEVSGDFSSSDFVKSVTGVDNVCERSAVRCGGGSLILRKTALDGVTVAAAEKPVILDFERKML